MQEGEGESMKNYYGGEYLCEYCRDGLLLLTGACPMCAIDVEYTYDTRAPEERDPPDLRIAVLRVEPISVCIAAQTMSGRPLSAYDREHAKMLGESVANGILQSIAQHAKVMPR